MKTGFVSKLRDAASKLFKVSLTPNAKNNQLTKMNGSVQVKNGSKDLLVNGSASFGSAEAKSLYSGIIVVNGSAKAVNSSFETLEINGSAHLENIEITHGLHLHGNAVLKACTIREIATYGDYTNVESTDSVVHSKLKV